MLSEASNMLILFIILSLLDSIKCAAPVDDYYFDDAIEMGSYIGVYLAVFVIALPFTAHFLDCIGILNPIIYRLGDKAHFNFMKELLIHREVEKHQKEHTFDQGEFAPTEQAVTSEEAAHIKERATVDIVYEKDCFGREKQCCGQKFLVHQYDDNFTESLLKLRAYYNSYDNKRMDSCCCHAHSISSDCLFYFLNNHSVFGMVAALPGHPFSRYDKRMAFIVRHGLAFFISILFFRLDLEESKKQALNTLFITPLMVFVNTSYYYILACPCLQGEHSTAIKGFFQCMEGLSSAFAHICCLISIIWIIVAGALTFGDDKYATLGKYIYQVLVFGLGLECILLWIKFFSSTFAIKFKVCGVAVFTISDWFYEYCECEKLERTERNLFIIPILLTFTIYTTNGVSLKEDIDLETGIEHVEVETISDPIVPSITTTSTVVTSDVAPQPPTGVETKPVDVAPPLPTATENTAPSLPTTDVAPQPPTGNETKPVDVAPPLPTATENVAPSVEVPPVEETNALPPGLEALESIQSGFN